MHKAWLSEVKETQKDDIRHDTLLVNLKTTKAKKYSLRVHIGAMKLHEMKKREQ